MNIRSIAMTFIGSLFIFAQQKNKQETYILGAESPPVTECQLSDILLSIMTYPEELIEQQIEGTVICRFTLTEEGTITDRHIEKSPHPALNKQAFLLLDTLYHFILPAKKDHKRIPYAYTLPIRFSIEEFKAYKKQQEDQERKIIEEGIFVNYQAMPYFPGGDKALLDFIKTNTRYPETLKGSGIKGRVVCSFSIDRLGRICNPEIVRGLHPECDAEALRVVGTLSDWYPARFKCKFVHIRYTVPIFFNE